MKKNLFFVGIIIIILIVGRLIYHNLSSKKEEVNNQISMAEKSLQDKNIAMIIAFRDFRDEEYFIPKQILQTSGAKVTTVSSSLGTAIGMQGGEAQVDILIKELQVADHDAILFVGGTGAFKYIDDENCHRIARETVEQNKVLGAICIAPAILAKAGVLQGKKATVWSSIMDKSAVKMLEEGGANFQSVSEVIDGKIATASGPAAAQDFAQTIISLLK